MCCAHRAHRALRRQYITFVSHYSIGWQLVRGGVSGRPQWVRPYAGCRSFDLEGAAFGGRPRRWFVYSRCVEVQNWSTTVSHWTGRNESTREADATPPRFCAPFVKRFTSVCRRKQKTWMTSLYRGLRCCSTRDVPESRLSLPPAWISCISVSLSDAETARSVRWCLFDGLLISVAVAWRENRKLTYTWRTLFAFMRVSSVNLPRAWWPIKETRKKWHYLSVGRWNLICACSRYKKWRQHHGRQLFLRDSSGMPCVMSVTGCKIQLFICTMMMNWRQTN